MLAQEEGLRDALGRLSGAALKGVSLGAGEIHVTFEQSDGVWGLGTGGSHWVLLKNDEPVVRDEDNDERVAAFDAAIGRHVIAAHPGKGDAALMVELEDGWKFCVVKSPVGAAAGLPIYELLSPGHRMLALQSDGVVDDFPSEVPITALLQSGQASHWPSPGRTQERNSFWRVFLRQSVSSHPLLHSAFSRLLRDLRR